MKYKVIVLKEAEAEREVDADPDLRPHGRVHVERIAFEVAARRDPAGAQRLDFAFAVDARQTTPAGRRVAAGGVHRRKARRSARAPGRGAPSLRRPGSDRSC